MKVLTIWNPWARLIAAGIKRVENRSHATDYRGPLLVHVGQHWKQDEVQEQLEGLRDDGLLDDTNTPALLELKAERGKVIAKTSIVGCRKVEEGDADPWAVPGAYAWELGPVELVEPFDLVGRQGLFELPAGIEVVALGQRLAVVVEKRTPASKAERERLIAEVVSADDGHGYLGQVHDRETGEVCFTSQAFPTMSEAESAARAYVDDRVDAVARAKMARLDALEEGLAFVERGKVRLRELERRSREIAEEKKKIKGAIDEKLDELRSGQAHLDFSPGEDEPEAEVDEDDDAVELDVDTPDEEPVEDVDDEFGAAAAIAELAAQDVAGDQDLMQREQIRSERASALVQMSVNAIIDELRDEPDIEVIRAVMDAEGRKKKSLRRKSVMAFLHRRLEQLLVAEEQRAAKGAA